MLNARDIGTTDATSDHGAAETRMSQITPVNDCHKSSLMSGDAAKPLTSHKKPRPEKVRHFVSQVEAHIIRFRNEGVANFSALARALNERGVKSPRATKWHPQTTQAFIERYEIDFVPSESRFSKSKDEIKKQVKNRSETLKARVANSMRNRQRQRRFADFAPLSQNQINDMVANHIAAGKVTKCPPCTDSEGNIHGSKLFALGFAARPGVTSHRFTMERA